MCGLDKGRGQSGSLGAPGSWLAGTRVVTTTQGGKTSKSFSRKGMGNFCGKIAQRVLLVTLVSCLRLTAGQTITWVGRGMPRRGFLTGIL